MQLSHANMTELCSAWARLPNLRSLLVTVVDVFALTALEKHIREHRSSCLELRKLHVLVMNRFELCDNFLEALQQLRLVHFVFDAPCSLAFPECDAIVNLASRGWLQQLDLLRVSSKLPRHTKVAALLKRNTLRAFRAKKICVLLILLKRNTKMFAFIPFPFMVMIAKEKFGTREARRFGTNKNDDTKDIIDLTDCNQTFPTKSSTPCCQPNIQL